MLNILVVALQCDLRLFATDITHLSLVRNLCLDFYMANHMEMLISILHSCIFVNKYV